MEKEKQQQKKTHKSHTYKKDLGTALLKAKTAKQKQNIKKDIFVKVLAEEQVAGNVFVACQWLDFDRSHMYSLKRQDDKFSKKWEEAVILGENKVLDIMENTLYRRAISGHVTALIFTLKNRRSTKWTDRRSYDGGSPNEPIKVKHTYGDKTVQWLEERLAKSLNKQKPKKKKNDK